MLNIVWHDRKEEVREEMKRLHAEAGGVGELTANDEFTMRNTAAKQWYNRLSADEKAMFQIKARSYGQEANPPDIQKKYIYNNCVQRHVADEMHPTGV